MLELLVIVIVLHAVYTILKATSTAVENFTLAIWSFLKSLYFDMYFYVIDDIYLIGGFVFLFLAFVYLYYTKPHPATKYFEQYKKKEITRTIAIKKMAETLYSSKEGIPSAVNSRVMAKRIKALRIRIQTEEAFIRDLKSYIRTKES